MPQSNSQNPQTESSQQKSSKPPKGHELIIGERLKEILKSGGALIIIGVILLLLSIFSIDSGNNEKLTEADKRKFEATTGFCINVGVALVAAGLLTVTVESNAKKQQAKQYEELLDKIEGNTQERMLYLTTASQDLITSLIQNENIFTQIRNHILHQDFILEQYKVILSLEWFDNQKIREEVHMEYLVRNISFTEKLYPVNIFINNNASTFNLTPCITEYSVDGDDRLDKDLENELLQHRQSGSSYIGFENNVPIKPNLPVKIEIEFNTYREANDHEPFLTSQITDKMQLHLTNCPEDITFLCIPLHPTQQFFKKPKHGQRLNRIWKINTGLLPYQGFYFCWRKNQELDKQAFNKDAVSIAKISREDWLAKK